MFLVFPHEREQRPPREPQEIPRSGKRRFSKMGSALGSKSPWSRTMFDYWLSRSCDVDPGAEPQNWGKATIARRATFSCERDEREKKKSHFSYFPSGQATCGRKRLSGAVGARRVEPGGLSPKKFMHPPLINVYTNLLNFSSFCVRPSIINLANTPLAFDHRCRSRQTFRPLLPTPQAWRPPYKPPPPPLVGCPPRTASLPVEARTSGHPYPRGSVPLAITCTGNTIPLRCSAP